MSAEQHALLRQRLAITPKTATLLIRAGYKDYRDLQHVSPIYIVSQFAKQPGVSLKLAKGYQRALRRMVWLGTQDTPEEQAKICKDWSNKALMAKGVWVEGFDDLTGREINERFEKAARKKGG